MPQRKPLKVDEIAFVEAKVAGKSNTEAAMIAKGSTSKDVAKTQGHRLSTNVNVQQAIAEAFERHGITIDKAVKPIADGLAATKQVFKNNNESGTVELVGETPDHTTRLKASGMAFNLMGLNKPEGGTTNNFLIISNDQKEKYGM